MTNPTTEPVDASNVASPPGTRRCFVALSLGDEGRAQLADYGRRLAATAADVRPVAPEALHLTLAYLGTIDQRDLAAAADAMVRVAATVPGPTGCASSATRVLGGGRAFAVHVDVDLFAVVGFARDQLMDALVDVAPEVDRRGWSPHVTVLRGTGGKQLPPGLRDEPIEPPPIRWVADELQLLASPRRPTDGYELLHRVRLGGRPQ